MPQAKFIVLFSTKGGVGKTLLSVNLAVSLSRESQKRVCLVDFDLQAPMDMARMLDLQPAKSLADVPAEKEIKEPEINSLIVRHTSGIDFLPAALRPNQSPYIEKKIISAALSGLEVKYDYVVVDAGRAFSDNFISVLGFSNLILMVVTPDILSIYQTKWALDVLQSLHFPLKMIKFILNRSDSLGGFAWQEVKSNLPAEILINIPSEGRAVGLSVNRRLAVVLDNPKSRFSQAVTKLTQELLKGEKDLFLKRIELDKLELAKEAPREYKEFWRIYGLMDAQAVEAEAKVDELVELKRRVHKRLIEELNLRNLDLSFTDTAKVKEIREKTEKSIANSLAEESGALLSSFEVRKHLIKEIADEALGLGPLEDLIDDPEISDIMVNNKDQIYVERQGKLELTSKRFISNEQVRQVIERIIAPLGRRIDESSPMVDARLSDGSRVNAIVSPLSLGGPMLTIRKFSRDIFTTDALMKFGSLNSEMAEFLKACVVSRKNIIVSGGTGSGKTTVLNVLSAFIPSNERIITIEDAAELKLSQEHWGRLESRPQNIEGKGAITIRDLFRNTLRMRPDRVIIGECRGAETLDMLQAMNTGHDGSMTTVHANSTQDVLARLDSMILMTGPELPVRAIREMIASAVDIIVHTARLSDGSRKVTQITQITGMKDEMHIGLQDIFSFRQTGIDSQGKVLGGFEPTGVIPTFIEDIRVRGIKLSDDIFKK
ncbi:MAG TPA: ATPase, T2SS/T4P/T4SS family [Candidatus Omnitrophota bacterium]|nr:ATPase, T2SS/T4P/T4SS family [Candidatus Omnitrophota bacterium]